MANSLFNCRLLALLCLLSVSFLPGCGDETGVVGGIAVSPSKVTVGVNQSKSFDALARSGRGFLTRITPVWSVTGPIGTINSVGYFLAGSVEGTGVVVATDSGSDLTGSAEVTITKKGWLTGLVTDSNAERVIGIRVFLTELPLLGDETDASGNYTISDIPAGTYEARINVQQQMLEPATAEVTIGEGLTVTQNFSVSVPVTSTTTTTTL